MARARLAHLPALDGLRGVAVGAVLCFHGDLGELGGGFLGVSTFFTLSGFLITSLLLVEHRDHGSVDLGAFWTRRARRLLPGAIAGLALAVAISAVLANPVALRELPGEVTAALGYSANWWFLHADVSYGERFFAPSAVGHYWSLAIEEQFYVVLPVVVLLVGWRRRSSRAVLGVVCAAGIAASVLVSAAVHEAGGDTDRAYYGSDARAAELLVGSLLAVVLLRRTAAPSAVPAPGAPAAVPGNGPGAAPAAAYARSGSRRRALRRDPPRVGRRVGPVEVILAAAGAVALAALAGIWHTAELADDWLYEGGFALHAALSAAVVAACTVPGPVRALLSAAPLRWLGRHSYGLYLYHWPIFLLLNAGRVHWSTWPLFGLRVSVTLVAAVVSMHLVETPIRMQRSPLAGRAGLVAAPLIGALVVAGAFVARARGPEPPTDFDAALRDAPQVLAEIQAGGAPSVTVLGDSTGLVDMFGLGAWGQDSRRLAVTDASVELGCTIGRDGELLDERSVWTPLRDVCRWDRAWPDHLRDGTDGALLFFGAWDLQPRRDLPGIHGAVRPPDAAYRRYLHAEMRAAAALVEQKGVRVIWVTTPPLAGRSAEAVAWFNTLVEQVAAEGSNSVVLDLHALVASWPPAKDRDRRPDGVHFSDRAIEVVSREWLGDAVVDALAAPPGTVVRPAPDDLG